MRSLSSLCRLYLLASELKLKALVSNGEAVYQAAPIMRPIVFMGPSNKKSEARRRTPDEVLSSYLASLPFVAHEIVAERSHQLHEGAICGTSQYRATSDVHLLDEQQAKSVLRGAVALHYLKACRVTKVAT